MPPRWTQAAGVLFALSLCPAVGASAPVDDFRAGPGHPVRFSPSDPRRAVYAEALAAQTRRPGESDPQYRARLVAAAAALGITNPGESARVAALYLPAPRAAGPAGASARPVNPADLRRAQEAYERARGMGFGAPPSAGGLPVRGPASSSATRAPTQPQPSRTPPRRPTFAPPPPPPVPARPAPARQGWSDYFIGLARRYDQTAGVQRDDGSFRYWRTRTWNQLKGAGAAILGVALQPKTYTERIPNALTPSLPLADHAAAELRRAPSWRAARDYALAYGMVTYEAMTYKGVKDVIRHGLEADVGRVGAAGKHLYGRPSVASGLDAVVASAMLVGDVAPVKGAVGGATETAAREAAAVAAEEASAAAAGETAAVAAKAGAAAPRGPLRRLLDGVRGRSSADAEERATLENVARDPKAHQALTGTALARVDEMARSGRLRLVDVKPGSESTLRELPVRLVPGRYYVAVKTENGIVLTDYSLRHGGHRMLTMELGLPAPRKLDTPGTTVGGVIFYDDGVAVSGQALRYPSEQNAAELARALKGMGFRILEKRGGPIRGPNSSIPSEFDARNMPIGI